MAAANPALPTFTGDPEIDRNIATGIQNFLQQNAASEHARQQQAGEVPPGTPPAAQPWKVNVQGREYSFNNQQELEQALSATFNQFQNTLQSMQPPPTPDPAPARADEAPKFSTEHYVDTLKQDPIAAQEYLDSHRYFGGKVEKPSELIRAQLQESEKNARLLAVYQFKEAHPEYQGNPQTADVINKLRSELNLPFDFNGLEAAYALARQRGMIAPPQGQYPGPGQYAPNQGPQFVPQGNPFQYQPPTAPPIAPPPGPPSPYGADPRAFNGGAGFGMGNNPYLAPPPALPGRGGFDGSPNLYNDAENLTPEQIQQVFSMVGARPPQRF